MAYRTFGLAVALLGVLSRVRRPLAQMWDAQHDVDFFLWLERQSIQQGGLSASDAAHISKRKGGTTRQPPCFWLFGHVLRKRGSRHGLSNVVDDTSGAQLGRPLKAFGW